MDSNVSKGTFLHKFFKLGFNSKQRSLSIQELLKYSLLSVIDLYQCQLNYSLNTQFETKTKGCKIVVLQPNIDPISFDTQTNQVLLTSKLLPIVYSSSIALSLASQVNKSSQTVAQELIDLLVVWQNRNKNQSYFYLGIEITQSGLINFYLDGKSVALWLEESLTLINTEITNYAPDSWQLKSSSSTSINLFPFQYVFARCCSALRLGAEEKLFFYPANPQFIAWLDPEENLWLREEVEFNLIRQLCLVADSFATESANWHKLALHLSEITMMFLAECRFLGEVRQKTPQKAIARLGLIAITRYWLGRILVEKLNICAPTSL